MTELTTSGSGGGPNWKAVALVSLAFGLDTLLSVAAARASLRLLPPQASSAATYVDGVFALEVGIGCFIFLGCIAAMGWSLLFHRAPKYDLSNGAPIEGNLRLEIIWTIIPLVVVMAIATYSFRVNDILATLGPKVKYLPGEEPAPLTAPGEYGPIDVIARQWSWEFLYPNGVRSTELHLPLDERSHFRLISEDVIHGFFVPAFRLKQDLVPGSVIGYSLTPTRRGVYRLRDSQFSGGYFASNQADVVVEPRPEFDRWLEEAAASPPVPSYNAATELYRRRLDRGDRGWATVPPAAPPMVNASQNPDLPHDA
jgi:cytochrome c oxidase subunit 2